MRRYLHIILAAVLGIGLGQTYRTVFGVKAPPSAVVRPAAPIDLTRRPIAIARPSLDVSRELMQLVVIDLRLCLAVLDDGEEIPSNEIQAFSASWVRWRDKVYKLRPARVKVAPVENLQPPKVESAPTSSRGAANPSSL